MRPPRPVGDREDGPGLYRLGSGETPAAVLGRVCPRGAVGVWRWWWALQGCEDAVEGGLEADHLGLHDLGAHE